ncbi:ISKra4 family transposase [Moorena sp. SIO3H5]|uniref:ISKra4 family transposase n=1 Tax=Moorena sp. SIO3H5 TaxID=2607834 RepID=UPI0013BBB51F|nr:ISKra4 family transposase [Moorena sp. SIO3H5]NEO69608.1 ISKra4 family transposase [Moorena sp. SIO3H5]
MNLSPEEKQELKEHLKAVAQLLYRHTPPGNKQRFEDLETTLRDYIQEEVSPEIAKFFFPEVSQVKIGRARRIKTIVGEVEITDKQADYFELKPYSQLSPKLEKNALLICANESYKRAEEDFWAMTGIKISHSTLHRLVKKQELDLPESRLGIQEVSLDAGKIRLRTEEKGKPCEWKDYKAVCLNGTYIGAFFQENQVLIDWINSQKLLNPFFCRGDGHQGIWNVFEDLGEPDQRREILDWYHLKENLYKVGGSLKRLQQGEKLLWSGKVAETLDLFRVLKKKAAQNFCNYIETHKKRIINYDYYQKERISSLGSGAIESGIKQIGMRVKLSGSQWNIENVPQILSLRCAYLNGMLY